MASFQQTQPHGEREPTIGTVLTLESELQQ